MKNLCFSMFILLSFSLFACGDDGNQTCSPPCSAGSVCVKGECQKSVLCQPPCAPGTTCVGGTCQSASCKPACASGYTCTNGNCVENPKDICKADDDCDGLSCCEGTCVNLKTNSTFCGSCSEKCIAGQVCINDSAAINGRICTCPEGESFCNDICMKYNTSEHCGDCNKVCKDDEHCILNDEIQNFSCLKCNDDENFCNNKCVKKTDPLHCGKCDNPCGEAACFELIEDETSYLCRCENEKQFCQGKCVELHTDEHCRDCNDACTGGQKCLSSAEGFSCQCPVGQIFLDSKCMPMSENCGELGLKCLDGAQCKRDTSAQTGYACKCPSSLDSYCDGVCVFTTTEEHCGTCGNKCNAGDFCLPKDYKSDGWEYVCRKCEGPAAAHNSKLKICNGECKAINTWPACADCNHACSNTQICCNGQCVPPSNSGCGMSCEYICASPKTCKEIQAPAAGVPPLWMCVE